MRCWVFDESIGTYTNLLLSASFEWSPLGFQELNRETSCSFMDISITSTGLICPAKLWPVSSNTNERPWGWCAITMNNAYLVNSVFVGSSCSFIFPLGKPHSDEDFHHFTRIHWNTMGCWDIWNAIWIQQTFSYVLFNIIAPQTGTLVLYHMKVLNAHSWSWLHWCNRQAQNNILENFLSSNNGNSGVCSQTKSS